MPTDLISGGTTERWLNSMEEEEGDARRAFVSTAQITDFHASFSMPPCVWFLGQIEPFVVLLLPRSGRRVGLSAILLLRAVEALEIRTEAFEIAGLDMVLHLEEASAF